MVSNDRGQGRLLGQDSRPQPALNRSQLVDRILEMNPSATPEFLRSFSEGSLAHYLEHLSIAGEPTTPWIRRGISPGIVRREAAE
jgi:hypothetical protein